MDTYQGPTGINAFMSTGALVGLFAFLLVSAIVVWKIFEKAGQPGWAALVPVYNIVVLMKITGSPVWWTILFFAPFFNVIFVLITYHKLSSVFGKGIGMTILLLLLVGFPILAFGNAKYTAPKKKEVIT